MKNIKLSTNAHGMEAVWTLTSLTRKRSLPVPEVWYTAAAFTRRRIKRRPGCIKHAESKGISAYLYEVVISLH